MTYDVAHRPSFPPDAAAYGIGVLGAGAIAHTAHLPAYAEHGLDVVGVWSRTPRPTSLHVYDSPDALLADPRVAVVDLAGRVDDRLHWLSRALDAGQHVLAQKPLATSADSVAPLVSRARDLGLRVAVNQNARWAPVWRVATRLIEQGAVGDVVGMTHVLDKPLPPLVGTPFDAVPHMLLADYLEHWIDITHCWLRGKQVASIRASDGRLPGQPAEARNPWRAGFEITCADGTTATARIPGHAVTRTPSCPFWVHGTEGTIRGSILGGEHVALERDGVTTSFALEGAWFVDGFAGTMGELLTAVSEDREPSNSAADNLATLRLVEAVVASADASGEAVPVQVAL